MITKIVISGSFIQTAILAYMFSIVLAMHVQGQDLSEPKISLKVENIPLSEVLQILELKTKFTFSYLNKELPPSERVTLDVKDKSLQQILEILRHLQ